MANQPNQKLKLLYVLKTLLDKTDDVNGVTTQDLIDELALYDIDAERKSINRDIQTLRDFGYDICQRSHKYWYLANRPLDLWELRLLYDAVQTSSALSKSESEALTAKLMEFASEGQKKELKVAVETQDGSLDEDVAVFDSIAVIRQAMAQKRRISFVQKQMPTDAPGQAITKDPAKAKKSAGSKAKETVAPWQHKEATPVSIVYAQGYYWLVVFFDAKGDVDEAIRSHGAQGVQGAQGVPVHRLGKPSIELKKGERGWFDQFRIDRIQDVRILDASATRNAQIANWQLDTLDAPQFGMEGIRPTKVNLIAIVGAEDTIHEIFERFNGNVHISKINDAIVRLSVKAPLSRNFFGWLASLGGDVGIEGPKQACEAYRSFLQGALNSIDRVQLIAENKEELAAEYIREQNERARVQKLAEAKRAEMVQQAKAKHDAQCKNRNGICKK